MRDRLDFNLRNTKKKFTDDLIVDEIPFNRSFLEHYYYKYDDFYCSQRTSCDLFMTKSYKKYREPSYAYHLYRKFRACLYSCGDIFYFAKKLAVKQLRNVKEWCEDVVIFLLDRSKFWDFLKSLDLGNPDNAKKVRLIFCTTHRINKLFDHLFLKENELFKKLFYHDIVPKDQRIIQCIKDVVYGYNIGSLTRCQIKQFIELMRAYLRDHIELCSQFDKEASNYDNDLIEM